MFKSLSVKFMLGITGIVAAVLLVSLIWDFQYQQEQVDREILAKADLIAKQQEASRSFIAKSQDTVHGGDRQTLAPSEVGKGVGKLFADLAQSRVKQTRLEPRLKENMPDEFEIEALRAFEADPALQEYFRRVQMPDGSAAFRYVEPLHADKSCLTCHGDPKGELDKTNYPKEGMQEGDLAGAISVTVPLADALAAARTESIRMAVGVLALAVMTLALIWFILYRQVSVPLRSLAAVAQSVGGGRLAVPPEDLKELNANRETAIVADAFEDMSRHLQDLYSGMEQKVLDRTAQLQEANRELERSDRLKSEFLTMISHEFRTPLTSIITFTELLLGDAAGKINPEQRDYLTDVLESSQKLLYMINDLLDMSRLGAGRVQLFREVVNIRDLARDARGAVWPLAERKGLTLLIEIAPDMPLVYADGLRVTQVLINLLGNAVKFTAEGGAVVVTARSAGDFLQVTVTDSGVGIPSEDQSHIFEPFHQVGSQRQGWGLGLTLARSLVELHGGRIWFESEPGIGSRFHFTLPVWTEEGRVTYDQQQTDSRG